jgi:hypothetical protein
MGSSRTAWHVAFARLLSERAPPGFAVQAEVSLGGEPQVADLLLCAVRAPTARDRRCCAACGRDSAWTRSWSSRAFRGRYAGATWSGPFRRRWSCSTTWRRRSATTCSAPSGEERLAGLAPEERLAGLAPGEQLTLLPSLPLAFLRTLSDQQLAGLPADVRAAIRRRLDEGDER